LHHSMVNTRLTRPTTVSDAPQGATVWEWTAPINFLFTLLVTRTRGRDRAVRESIWLGSVTSFAHPQ
jgi:hypothetical protein